MLRIFVPTVARRLISSSRKLASDSVPNATRAPLHQPLGIPPEGTNLDDVRAKWGSNAMDLVQQAEVVKVKGPVAICDGGGGPLGHPIEYIQLNRADSRFPAICKYCGARFAAEH